MKTVKLIIIIAFAILFLLLIWVTLHDVIKSGENLTAEYIALALCISGLIAIGFPIKKYDFK